jgi:hypothetical protein
MNEIKPKFKLNRNLNLIIEVIDVACAPESLVVLLAGLLVIHDAARACAVCAARSRAFVVHREVD